MAAVSFDPWRAQARLAWRNRVARWRAERAQTAFHAIALLALGGLVGVPVARHLEAWGEGVASAWQRWPVPIAIALAAAFAMRQAQAWSRTRDAQARGWLAALPVAPSVRRTAQWRAVRREACAQLAVLALAWCGMAAALHAVPADRSHGDRMAIQAGRSNSTAANAPAPRAGAPLDSLDSLDAVDSVAVDSLGSVDALDSVGAVATMGADSSARPVDTVGAGGSGDSGGMTLPHFGRLRDAGLAWLALVVGAALAGPVLSRGVDAWRRTRVAVPVSSVIADRGAGRVWRWQRLACGVALHGRTLAWGALAWLLVPMQGGVGALIAVGVAGIGTALLSGAWRRSLAVLPQAQAWLAAQPLPRGALLRATWAVPAAVLATSVAALALLAFAVGRPAWAMPLGAAVLAIGALQYAASAAWRRTPSRIALAFLVQLVVLLGVLQGFPLAALPLWMVQMIVLLRRARA